MDNGFVCFKNYYESGGGRETTFMAWKTNRFGSIDKISELFPKYQMLKRGIFRGIKVLFTVQLWRKNELSSWQIYHIRGKYWRATDRSYSLSIIGIPVDYYPQLFGWSWLIRGSFDVKTFLSIHAQLLFSLWQMRQCKMNLWRRVKPAWSGYKIKIREPKYKLSWLKDTELLLTSRSSFFTAQFRMTVSLDSRVSYTLW